MAWCRRDSKGLVLHLEEGEVLLLRFLGGELGRLLQDGDFSKSAMHAFSPRQQRQADPNSAPSELDEAMDAELLAFRLERLEAVSAEILGEPTPSGKGLTLKLEPARVDTWLGWLTDLRLLLGAVLGLGPENQDPLDESDPDEWTPEQRMYVFLSGLQDILLRKSGF